MSTLADELVNVRDAFDLDVAAIEELCLAGVDAAWLDDADRRAHAGAFVAEMAALR